METSSALSSNRPAAPQDHETQTRQPSSLSEVCGIVGIPVRLESPTVLLWHAFRSRRCRRWLWCVLQAEFRTFLSRLNRQEVSIGRSANEHSPALRTRNNFRQTGGDGRFLRLIPRYFFSDGLRERDGSYNVAATTLKANLQGGPHRPGIIRRCDRFDLCYSGSAPTWCYQHQNRR
jgi:hypothetical protein